MRIGLIDPGSKKLAESFPHIGLAYIAACLEREGHEVGMLDTEMATHKEVETFLSSPYDLFGITVTSFTVRAGLEMVRRLKEANPHSMVVFGGSHISVVEEQVLDYPEIDYAIWGEGEIPLPRLARALEEDPQPSREVLEGINGLIFRDGDEVVKNPRQDWIADLDSNPYPAYHLLPIERYKRYPLLTSRGCPFNCAFCATVAVWGRRYRSRTPENIVGEMKRNIEEFGWKPFSVVDDLFNVNVRKARAICQAMIESGLKLDWECWGIRADLAELELLKLMKKAGCRAISIGVESANAEVLRLMQKAETPQEIAQGIANILEAGLDVVGQFMIGNQGDTLETIKESIEFIKRTGLPNARFYMALPYPKTALGEYARRHGRLFKTDYTTYHHFSDEPVWDTPEFPIEERMKAKRMARRFELRHRLRMATTYRLKRRLLDGEYWRTPRLLKEDVRKLFRTAVTLALGRKQEI